MSKQSVEQMIQAAESDPALQQKLQSANGFAATVRIGAESGYSFSEEDARSILTERGINLDAGGELSEESLEAIAGGNWTDNNNVKVRVTVPW